MEKWEVEAREFIDTCHFKDDIEAVFLTGSYAFGNADEFSDIDLYIILSDDVNWRERGNKRVNGFLIEYFANPARQVKKYIDSSYPSAQLTEITMILGGTVIFDKGSEGRGSVANEMIDYCKQKMLCEFPQMSEFNLKSGLYNLWHNYDELQRAHTKQTPDFLMQSFCFVRHAFEFYSRYVCSPVPSYYHLHRWLTDDDYFKRYGLAAHNDRDFVEIIKKTFECQDQDNDAMFGLAKNIYSYITDKTDGFDIDDFVLRSQCD